MLKLKVETWNQNTHSTGIHGCDDVVRIIITEEELERHIKPTLAMVDVVRKDGSKCRFFLNAGIGKSGRPKAELAYNRPTGTMEVTRRSVTGSFQQ